MFSLKEIIKNAENRKIALGHFNISTLEQLRGITEAAEELNCYVMLGVSEGERKFLGIDLVKDLIDYYNRHLKKKLLFLSADHTFETFKEAAECGYDLIVIDFSEFPLERNIEETREAVKLIKSINRKILVEGEIGHLAGQSKILKEPPKTFLTKPEEAEIFVKKTKIDLLAPSVGNFHGKVKNFSPKIDFNLIKEIKKRVEIPLVLHGGSGIKDADVKKAVKSGISVIHYNTDIREVWRNSLEKILKENKKEITPYKIFPQVINEIKENVKSKIKKLLF